MKRIRYTVVGDTYVHTANREETKVLITNLDKKIELNTEEAFDLRDALTVALAGS